MLIYLMPYRTRRIDAEAMSRHTFRVFPADRLSIVQWFGQVTFADVLAWLDEMIATPSFSVDFDGVVDLRKADLALMRPDEVKAIAQNMIDRRLTRGKWVHLVAGPMETALSLMYSRAVSEQYRMHVFSTIESAAEFLGRDAATLAAIADRAPFDSVGRAVRR
jgi:hypothetical protein